MSASAREEIDCIAAASAGGRNFGWRIREGNIAGIGCPKPGRLTSLECRCLAPWPQPGNGQ